MKQLIPIVPELTMITDEQDHEPEIVASNPGQPITVQCPICKEIIEVPEYDSVTRSDALIKHLRQEHTGVLSSGSPPEPSHESGYSTFHTLMLHAVAEMYEPGGIVVDEAKARATPCSCVEYKLDKFLCTSPGVVGALTDEQEGIYCNPRELVDRPGIRERMAAWSEAVGYCKGQLPPTDGQTRLEVYLDCMSKRLKANGVEA